MRMRRAKSTKGMLKLNSILHPRPRSLWRWRESNSNVSNKLVNYVRLYVVWRNKKCIALFSESDNIVQHNRLEVTVIDAIRGC